jgi:glycosyltransferase involved in cell wall biosynthesis
LPLRKIAISSWLAELVTQAGVPKKDVQAIPIAVDHNRFRVINSIRERAKRVVMLYSSITYKRSQLGLSVLLKCKDAVPNLEVNLFGPLEQRPATPPSWSEYYGSVSESELIKLYNAASIYLCSSAAEGFALPPAEAMACGCAVATTDCGGNRDYAEHEKLLSFQIPMILSPWRTTYSDSCRTKSCASNLRSQEETESQSSRGRKAHGD